MGAAATVVSRVSIGVVVVDSVPGSAVVEERKVDAGLVILENAGAKEDAGARMANELTEMIFILLALLFMVDQVNDRGKNTFVWCRCDWLVAT